MAQTKGAGKRPALAVQGPSKKRKLAPSFGKSPHKTSSKSKGTGKEKASDRVFIPIPNQQADDEVELSDQDLEFFDEFNPAGGFLDKLDRKGITRSKNETERLHRLNKPAAPKRVKDDLPSIDSHDEDGEQWSSGMDDDDLSDDMSDEKSSLLDSDVEQPYETMPRKRRPSWNSEDGRGHEALPIKLMDGRIQRTGIKIVAAAPVVDETDSDSEDEELDESQTRRTVEDVSTGARFGRPAVIDVIGTKSRKTRIQAAKEQIAGICQEIVADPENNLGLLKRLHTFSLVELATPSHPDPVANDIIIRKLAILSQLAVFKDIIPAYRIRALTDKEKAEKVSQMVMRTREWEQGLVSVYQGYLRLLEKEVKSKSDLSEVALQCMCTLLVDATHFNFRGNLMSAVVARLSKKSWDKSSDLCLNTLVNVFRADLTGQPSLEVVRLLNRMIKERRFNVHPAVLSCLLHLRLKTELSVRSSDWRADKETKPKSHSKGRESARRAKGKPTERPHLSKNAKKATKENKEIEAELQEAEAEVDKEERASTHTETLKLLFVLYFRIVKNPRRTPLLPAALQGLSRYAHLVNVDFFKDLLKVLKEIVSRRSEESGDDEDAESAVVRGDVQETHERLMCIATAFELLSGQGEALNIDLDEFITQLYSIILTLADIEAVQAVSSSSAKPQSTADILFRALYLVFSPRSSVSTSPPWRSAAFAKRLLIAALHWPAATVLRVIEFVGTLIAKEPKLDALLSADDRAVNGVYRAELDDPQLCNPFGTSFWELGLLERGHADSRVRAAAGRLLNFTRS